MVTTKIGEQQEDFLAQILRLIDNYEINEAIRKLKEIKNKIDLFDTLFEVLNAKDSKFNIKKLKFMLGTVKSLARTHDNDFASIPDLANTSVDVFARTHDLANILSSDFTHAFGNDFTTAHVHAQAGVRDLTNDLRVASDSVQDLSILISKGDIDNISDLTNDFIRARAHARASARDLASALNLINTLDEDFEYIFEDFEAIVQFILISINHLNIRSELLDDLHFRYRNRLARIVNEISYLNTDQLSPTLKVIDEVIWNEIKNYPLLVTLEGVDKITPSILSNQISPFFQAMDGLYQTHLSILAENQILQEDIDSELRIIKMHNSEPKFEVNFGVSDFIRTLNDVFNFNKRKDEARLRKLQIAKEELDYDKDKLLNPIEIESERLDMMMKIARVEAELTEIYLEKAEGYLNKFYPHLSDQQRIEYAPSVAKYLMQGQLTDLRIRMGWTKTPPPKKLPK